MVLLKIWVLFSVFPALAALFPGAVDLVISAAKAPARAVVVEVKSVE